MKVQDYYKFNPLDQEVGIEIEMEGPRRFPVGEQTPKGWLSTEDGSLRGHSIEYITGKPIYKKEVNEYIDAVIEKLQSTKTTITHSFRAGVHVHMNVRPFTIEEVAKIALVYYIMEPSLIRFCGENRKGNLFCLRLEDSTYPLGLLEDALLTQDLSYVDLEDIRYASLNFRSIHKHGSLEFRALETPTDLNKIKIWVDILFKIRDYALKIERKKLALEISFKGPEDWYKLVLGDDLFNTLNYEGLEKDTFRSLRNVQTLIFL